MAAIPVTTTPVLLPASKSNDRPLLQNLGPDDLWFDRTQLVSEGSGLRVEVGQTYELPTSVVRGGGPIWLVSSGSSDVRYMTAG